MRFWEKLVEGRFWEKLAKKLKRRGSSFFAGGVNGIAGCRCHLHPEPDHKRAA
jgi:hypothetical protein